MSSEPFSLADPGEEPLYLGWYSGPRRPDGDSNARIQIIRGEATIQMSIGEITRLVFAAGITTWTPIPYSEPLD